MRRSGRRPTRKACLSICLPPTRLTPDHIGMHGQIPGVEIDSRHPSWVREKAVRSGLTATPAGTSGTTSTISRSPTLRPDGGGCPRTICQTYRSGGLRRSRSVRKYTDRLIKARVAAAMAPAHQYQPPSVTAATIKPAASTTSVMASPSRHHRGDPEVTLSAYLGQAPRGKARHGGVASAQLMSTTPTARRMTSGDQA
jgi:hypothetical protein